MSRTTIAGQFAIPDSIDLTRPVTITATLDIYAAGQDQIHVSTWDETVSLPGERYLELVGDTVQIGQP